MLGGKLNPDTRETFRSASTRAFLGRKGIGLVIQLQSTLLRKQFQNYVTVEITENPWWLASVWMRVDAKSLLPG